MFTISAAIFIALIAIVPGLKSGWFALCSLVGVGLSYLLHHHGFVSAYINKENLLYAAILNFIVINLFTILVYYTDKKAAIKQRRRIPEKTMHGFALAGGSISAYYAAKWFRHKTKKRSFRKDFLFVVCTQVLFIGFALYLYLDDSITFSIDAKEQLRRLR